MEKLYLCLSILKRWHRTKAFLLKGRWNTTKYGIVMILAKKENKCFDVLKFRALSEQDKCQKPHTSVLAIIIVDFFFHFHSLFFLVKYLILKVKNQHWKHQIDTFSVKKISIQTTFLTTKIKKKMNKKDLLILV